MKNAPLHKSLRPLAAALAAVLLGTAMLPPLAYAQARDTRFKGEPVTLNFVNAEIEGVSRAMGAILKQQFVVDPRVKGTITLYSEEPLSPREAYLNYLAALRGLGFTVVESGGLFKVVPEADAKLQSSTVSVGAVARQGDQVLTQIFKLSHENANNLVPVLRPLISPNNTINANPGNNTLVITDYADNLARIAKIIAAMDTPSAGDVEIISLKHAVAADVATMVQRLSDGSATTGAPGVPGIGAATSSVMVDPRSNALIVRASTPARMASIKAIVEKLDRPTTGDNPMGNIYVVYLKNADATRLATVLRAAYTAGSTQTGGAGGLGGGGGGVATAPQSPANVGIGGQAAGNTAGGQSAAAASPINPAAAPSTGGMIQADPATNSLIITAPEPVYRQLRAVIDQLDSRRAQVYIESMIVEVVGNNAADFGFQWQGLSGKEGDKVGVVGGTNFGTTGNLLGITAALAGGTVTSASATLLGEGLNIGIIKDFAGTYGLAAIARFLQSQTNTNIVSTPNLITLDNEEAKIIVGSNVPFITGQFTNTGTATTNPFQTVERKDVGITLRIKPQIGETGTVRMTIYQESSSLSRDVAPGTTNAGPTTNKRSIESNVVVDDGQIIVLGGLIEDRFEETKNKVPLLGDIPLIGALFRSETREKRRTNLMVFLRPVVMRDGPSVNNFSLDRYDLIRATQKDSQPARSLVLPNDAPVVPPLRSQLESEQSRRQRESGTRTPPPAATPPQPVPVPLVSPPAGASAPSGGARTN
ncbi:type II secretion system secretin GspD [Piscinibacter sp. HJYY11]|uniref:type II secretion system secretin GspD n=1 Tax=Piscinibacter sp. HJYY11 TaxID=2801333 RepID=UPI0019203817|nr:type II secretion system secretin GspD [Piscinibacter sp. HJYY11]MBL0728111.1 type II secretion system secretin GspD [Piscinibacter sp. HJYY11]